METENMNKLVEWKAFVDTLWIKSASYAKVQVILLMPLEGVHVKW